MKFNELGLPYKEFDGVHYSMYDTRHYRAAYVNLMYKANILGYLREVTDVHKKVLIAAYKRNREENLKIPEAYLYHGANQVAKATLESLIRKEV